MKIAIIGGGPRGLITLGHLIHNFPDAPGIQTLTVALFEPFAPGGRVWRSDQPQELIMNTVASQVTLFDQHLTGPTLFEWAQAAKLPDPALQAKADALGAMSYAPRALMGAYANWYYDQLTAALPAGVTVEYHKAAATNVKKSGSTWTVSTAAGQASGFDQVVLTVNGGDNQPTQTELGLAKYANNHGLTYQSPTYPGDSADEQDAAHDAVIIRGLGMSFFDEMAKFTIGRGGQFSTNADGHTLTYQPSGREPHIYAGSRRGVPYYPKAVVPESGEPAFTARFMTRAQIEAHMTDGKITVEAFGRLLRREIELCYYQLTLKNRHPEVDRTAFTAQFVADPDAAIKAAPLAPQELLRWPQLLNPVAGTPITTTEDYQHAVLNWLQAIGNDASAGLGVGPLASTLNVIRNVRNVIRDAIAEHIFAEADYAQHFLGEFTSNVNFLSTGAPALRFQQLAALMRAGIVTIIGPQMAVAGANGQFVALSKFYPKEPVKAPVLIEARIPRLAVGHSKAPLLSAMFDSGVLAPTRYQLANGQVGLTNSISIDSKTDQAQTQPDITVFSTLTSGSHWLTTTVPMIGADDNLAAAEQISRRLLGLPKTADLRM